MVAPAGPARLDHLDAGIEVLRAWGLEVVEGAHLRQRHPTLSYLAGADQARAGDLCRAWRDPSVAAVFCARGGYGCLRTLQHLDLDALAGLPAGGRKVLVGSSDVTALHAVLGPRLGLATLFAPMIATEAFVHHPGDQEHLRRTLFTPEDTMVLRGGPGSGPLVGGTARGATVGGNLSLLVSGLGVPGVPPPPEAALALIEDVDEQPYRVDHFLTHLLRAGWFDRVAGVALGSWHRCGTPEAIRDVVVDRLAPLGVPVLWELGFGHGPRQLTVPLGVPAELDADAATLTLAHPALD